MTLDARTIGQEILGAEIVAGKELTEAAGSVFDAMEKGSKLWRQQSRWALEDYGDFLLSGLARPLDPTRIFTLLERRSEHIASGMQDLGDLIEKEFVPLSKIWTDFFGVVQQDWRQA